MEKSKKQLKKMVDLEPEFAKSAKTWSYTVSINAYTPDFSDGRDSRAPGDESSSRRRDTDFYKLGDNHKQTQSAAIITLDVIEKQRRSDPMDPVIFTPRLKLTLVTQMERGSPELEWLHELRSNKEATWWR